MATTIAHDKHPIATHMHDVSSPCKSDTSPSANALSFFSSHTPPPSTASILCMAASFPPFVHSSSTALSCFLSTYYDYRLSPADREWIERIFAATQIQHFNSFLTREQLFTSMTITQYTQYIKSSLLKLSLDAGEQVLSEYSLKYGMSRSSITHLIFGTMTGSISAPSMDVQLCLNLHLQPTVHRLNVENMGCLTGFRLMGLCNQIIQSNKNHKILIIVADIRSALGNTLRKPHVNQPSTMHTNEIMNDINIALCDDSVPAGECSPSSSENSSRCSHPSSPSLTFSEPVSNSSESSADDASNFSISSTSASTANYAICRTDVIVAALFRDGGAAAIIGNFDTPTPTSTPTPASAPINNQTQTANQSTATPTHQVSPITTSTAPTPLFAFVCDFSYLIPDTIHHAWLTHEDDGSIQLFLDKDLPLCIELNLLKVWNICVERNNLQHLSLSNCLFAMHTGGPRVLTSVQTALSLTPQQLCASWYIMIEKGNLSGASNMVVLHTLQRILRSELTASSPCVQQLAPNPHLQFPSHQQLQQYTHIIGISFGPGVGVELVVLEINPGLLANH